MVLNQILVPTQTPPSSLMKIFLLIFCSLASIGVPFASATAGVAGAHKIAAWTFQTGGPIRGSVLLGHDAIFFGSSDGLVYALNKQGGTLRWKFQTGGAIAGAPALSGNTLIVAGRSDLVYALDATTGAVKWTFKVGADIGATGDWDYFTASPVIDGSRVLVGSADGHLYALDVATGARHWAFATGDRLRATPLVADGTVYQPSGDDFIYALSAADGSLQWKFATEGVKLDRSQGFTRSDIFTRPSLSHGLLIFGSRDANVYAVSVATHEKAWSFHYDSTWAMATTADDDTVYVGWSTNNKISAHDLTTGTKKWDYTAGAHNYAPALLDGNAVVRGSADGRIYSFDRATGAVNWTYTVGAEIYSQAVRDGDALYVGADDGRLYALVDAPPAHKAVYLPEGLSGNATAFVVDPQLAPYLAAHGFELLESHVALAQFIENRRSDGEPSVIVFGYAQIPAEVMGEDPAQGALHAYLAAGGKVVWPWGQPNLILIDQQGNYLGRDPTLGFKLLGVTYVDFEDSGNYYARATQTGRNHGLPAWLKATFASIAPQQDVTPLAIDEYGRAIAWSKSFSPRPGSGWVQLRISSFGVPMTPDELACLRRVACHGVE